MCRAVGQSEGVGGGGGGGGREGGGMTLALQKRNRQITQANLKLNMAGRDY